ncbi:MAG: gliding motility-associated C-terminal domain-containing protein [Bacteroidia bacterium]
MRLSKVILFALLFGNFSANATHIVGGSFDITWLQNNDYELRIRMLRDCSSKTQFDNTITIGVFDKGTDSRIMKYDMTLGPVVSLNFISAKCFQGTPLTCVELGTYSIIITLSPSVFNNNAGYYFSWERCCRNGIISNIVDPGIAGMTFYMEIPTPKVLKNSSPRWNNNPRTLLCLENPFTYNLNFTDPDGDSLVYSLVTPLNGNTDAITPWNGGIPLSAPYSLVHWMPGFDKAHEITGNPPLTINSTTGEITVTPDATGIFVSTILVEEYRYGIKLGEVRLDLQYTVNDCMNNDFPVISYSDTSGLNIKKLNGDTFFVNIPNNLYFNIITTDFKDSLFVKIDGKILDSNIPNKPSVLRVDSGNLKTTARFSWRIPCELTGLPVQKFTVEVTNNGCPLPKTSKAVFYVKLVPMPLINPTHILCMSLVDNKETIIYWGDSTPMNNPYFSNYHLYRSSDNFKYTVLDSILIKKNKQYDDKNTPNYSLINYNYFMRGVNLCGFEGPPSDTMGTFDQLKAVPDQQKLTTVTVAENKRIKVLWPPSREKDFAQYYLYKATRNDTNFVLIKNFLHVMDTVFYDDAVDVKTTSYCYQLVMKDTCLNYGPMGQVSCSIVMKGKSDPFEQTLSWQPYNYWDLGTNSYNLYRMDTEQPYMKIAVNPSSASSFVDNMLNIESGKYTYYVEAKENSNYENPGYAEILSMSNEVELIQSPLLHVPNAFTPNNDGLNDNWGIHPVFVKDYDLKIYNRWGQLVFATTDKHYKWSGENKDGVAEPSEVYVYLITYTGWDDSTHTMKGNVTVIR